jgi:hypothetical protein
MGFAIPSARHKKSSSLSPLTTQQLHETVQKLKVSNGLNCAFIFGLKTTVAKTKEKEERTKDKMKEKEEGKLYSQQDSNGVKLRLDFDDRSFLCLGKSDDEIFCSEQSIKMTRDTPVCQGHLLSFADILMPFLEWQSCEYRHSKRVQGRNTHIIRFKGTTGQLVDIAYDPVFEAILQFEYLDEKEKVQRTFKLLDFKKIQGVWLMKSIEIKDVPSNATTQLTIERVALEQTIPASTFDKNNLAKPSTDHLTYAKI